MNANGRKLLLQAMFKLNALCKRRSGDRACAKGLSPLIVNRILQQHEYTIVPEREGVIKRIFVNQIPANVPCEDRMIASVVNGNGTLPALLDDQYLLSVIDGHGGFSCANYVASQLHQYLGCALAAISQLKTGISDHGDAAAFDVRNMLPGKKLTRSEANLNRSLLTDWVSAFTQYFSSLGDGLNEQQMHEQLLKGCFEQLDRNLIKRADEACEFLRLTDKSDFDALASEVTALDRNGHLENDGPGFRSSAHAARLVRAAGSGACCCTVWVKDRSVSVASIGDCFALLGRNRPLSGHGEALKHRALDTSEPGHSSVPPKHASTTSDVTDAVRLTNAHNNANKSEHNRIVNEHPNEEYVIVSGRLLACLLPFRAFGDVNFKLPLSKLNNTYRKLLGATFILPNYHSPPYLTASPEITSLKLTADDRFIIIASDGLSDMMGDDEAVSIVDHFLSIKNALMPCKLTDEYGRNLTLGALSKKLNKRAQALSRHNLVDSVMLSDMGEAYKDWSEENRTRPLSFDDHALRVPSFYGRAKRGGKGVDNEDYPPSPSMDQWLMVDNNAATYLIRHALGGNDPYKIDHVSLGYTLSHNNPRMVRDDITVMVIELDEDYLARNSSSPSGQQE